MSLPASYLALRKRLLLRIGIAGVLLIASAAMLIIWLGGAVGSSPISASDQPLQALQSVQASAIPLIAPNQSGTDNAQLLVAALREITLPEPVDGKFFEVLVQRQAAEQADADSKQPAAEASNPGRAGKLPKGPHLQVGIFAQRTNAEDLKAKLEAQGFPVYIETRVQVGTFANRKEAEKVREKLKAMGMETVFIPQ